MSEEEVFIEFVVEVQVFERAPIVFEHSGEAALVLGGRALGEEALDGGVRREGDDAVGVEEVGDAGGTEIDGDGLGGEAVEEFFGEIEGLQVVLDDDLEAVVREGARL